MASHIPLTELEIILESKCLWPEENRVCTAYEEIKAISLFHSSFHGDVA